MFIKTSLIAIATFCATSLATGEAQYNSPAKPEYKAPAKPEYNAPAKPEYNAPAKPEYRSEHGYKGDHKKHGYHKGGHHGKGRHHREGDRCRAGRYKCVGFNKSTFLQCANGRYVVKHCGPGTVCHQNGRHAIYCDYPKKLY